MLPAPRLVGLPLSRWLGVRDQARRPVKPNAMLEKHFLTEGWKTKEVSEVPEAFLLPAACMAAVRVGPGVVCGPGAGKAQTASSSPTVPPSPPQTPPPDFIFTPISEPSCLMSSF